MSGPEQNSPPTAIGSTPRWRSIVKRSLLGGLLLCAIGTAVLYARSRLSDSTDQEYLTCRAVEAEFTFDVVERGELESSASLEVRCEVESKDGKGMKIIQLVPEGSTVKEGDLLIRFDDSGLRNERVQQEIAINSAQAAVTQASNEVDSAKFSKREYELGTYPQELQKADSEIYVAEENLKRAEANLNHKRRMVSKGFSTRLELEAEFSAVGKTRRELDVANTKKQVLTDFTQVKTIRKHDADIGTAEAKLQSEQSKLEIEQRKLTRIDEQIAKCLVYAPRAGQVIYDHSQDQWGGSDNIIKEGVIVYERRVVLKMPDPDQMQVLAKIPEARVDKLKAGMLATIEVEGLPNVKLSGEVTRVNPFPAEGAWYRSGVKEYDSIVTILNPPVGLRSGMTAKVAIRAEHLDSTLQVPMQAVAEIKGGHYCLQKQNDGSLTPVPVLIGSSNEKQLVIRQGLKSQAELVLDPRQRLSQFESLPPPLVTKAEPAAKTPPETQATAAVKQQASPEQASEQAAVEPAPVTTEEPASTSTSPVTTNTSTTATTADETSNCETSNCKNGSPAN